MSYKKTFMSLALAGVALTANISAAASGQTHARQITGHAQPFRPASVSTAVLKAGDCAFVNDPLYKVGPMVGTIVKVGAEGSPIHSDEYVFQVRRRNGLIALEALVHKSYTRSCSGPAV